MNPFQNSFGGHIPQDVAGKQGENVIFIVYNLTDSPDTQAPFAFAQKGTVKAIAYDPTFDTVSPVSAQTFDIPACDYTIVSPKDEKTSLILDGNGYTTYYLPQGKQELVVQLAKEMPISGFRYTPNQGRDASGHISNYQLYINGKKATAPWNMLPNIPLRRYDTTARRCWTTPPK